MMYFLFEVQMFRLSCRIARVPLPQPLRVLGVVFVTIVVGFGSAGAIAGVIDWIYDRAGFPIWEVGVVGIFLELPIHMMLVSAIHAKIAAVPLRDALAVWFVEKLIKLLGLAILALPILGLVLLINWLG